MCTNPVTTARDRPAPSSRQRVRRWCREAAPRVIPGCRSTIDILVEHLKARGTNALYTSYRRGRGSPEGFYRSPGFAPTGDLIDDEIEAVLRW
ncbi:hypothetical protein [Nocardia sp. NPDC050793]|uniref:hypothetical protein n=1 Tax=Nocardia sp. NPDC050793 TaxID=3155159 RepID=UPI0033CDB0A1